MSPISTGLSSARRTAQPHTRQRIPTAKSTTTRGTRERAGPLSGAHPGVRSTEGSPVSALGFAPAKPVGAGAFYHWRRSRFVACIL